MTSSGIASPGANLASTLLISGRARCDMGTKPSTSSGRSTTTPDLCMRATLPSTCVPTAYCSASCGHGFSRHCLMPSEIRCLSLSIPRTMTSTFWPLCRISLGCLMRFVHDMSEM